MQTQKMSLANIKGKLSRDEMKKIMAGSGSEGSFKWICTCDNTMDTGVCSGGFSACWSSTTSYCQTNGYNGAICNISSN